MNPWKICGSISRMSIHINDIALLTDVQVTALNIEQWLNPISIHIGDRSASLSLSLAQSATLRTQLEQAESEIRTLLERSEGTINLHISDRKSP